jgi:hypothetical protein
VCENEKKKMKIDMKQIRIEQLYIDAEQSKPVNKLMCENNVFDELIF